MVRIRQVETAAELTSGCPPRYKTITGLQPSNEPVRLSPGGPVLRTAPDTLQVCRYRTSRADPGVGDWIGHQTLDRSRTAALLAAVQGAGTTRTCPPAATFVILSPSSSQSGPTVEVELGGCWRVLGDASTHGVGSADAAVVGSLLAP